MKAVLLAPLPPPAGGIALWTKRMLESSFPHGWTVDVVNEAIVGKRSLFGDDKKRRVFTELKRLKNIWKNLKIKLKDDDVKIVHSCIPAQPLPMIREIKCAKITHRRKRKFIVHFRCTVPTICNSRIAIHLLKKLIRNSDAFILLNKQSVDFMKKYTNKPLYLIPNFIQKKELVETKPINNELKTALYVGGCIKSKGCFDVIDVARQNPDINFRFVGNPTSEAIEYANGLNNVVFVGEQPKEVIKKELANADIFFFLSYFLGEGFSNSLVEAMASGLPCIVSDWAANKDMIEDKGGIVVNHSDVEAANNALQELKSKERRKECSEFNISKVKSEYIEDIVLSKYISCYEEVLK